jgi:hypothetical protein
MMRDVTSAQVRRKNIFVSDASQFEHTQWQWSEVPSQDEFRSKNGTPFALLASSVIIFYAGGSYHRGHVLHARSY